MMKVFVDKKCTQLGDNRFSDFLQIERRPGSLSRCPVEYYIYIHFFHKNLSEFRSGESPVAPKQYKHPKLELLHDTCYMAKELF